MAEKSFEAQNRIRKTGRKPWVLRRHRIVRAVFGPLIGLYTRLAYHIDVRPFQEQGDRQYLVLFNHQTPFDQFFVMMGIKGPVYYVASEDIFTNGLVSKLIRWLVAPIPIKKQMTDLRAVKNCVQVAKEGGTIALAPEGNRTFSGRTAYINPAIGKLAQLLKLPIAIFRIEGGYGIQPRWSDVIRKGRMTAGVVRVLEPEDYLSLSPDELCAGIREALYADENREDGKYPHNRAAEYLERMLYVCPHCGFSSFESSGRRFRCVRCGLTAEYGDNKEIFGIGCELPFRFAGEWYDYQERFVRTQDTAALTEQPLYTDQISLWRVRPYVRKERVLQAAEARLFGDRTEIWEQGKLYVCFRFSDCSVLTVLGRNKLNIYCGEEVFQLKGGKRFNALKYMNLFYRYRSITGGQEDGEFLGL